MVREMTKITLGFYAKGEVSNAIKIPFESLIRNTTSSAGTKASF